jgi:mRNA-degrading endonuclease RelE of RelBE toxin-antitoxin system
MPQPPGDRTVYFWQRQGSTSQVLRDLKKLPKPVFAYFIDRLNALATSGDSLPPKPLKHIGRFSEYIYRGPHGHYRLLFREEGDYIVALDVLKKQKNSTPTANAVARWDEWIVWH